MFDNQYGFLVRKRDGRIVPFDYHFINKAVHNAFTSLYNDKEDNLSNLVTSEVCEILLNTVDEEIVDIETIQDNVERVLSKLDYNLARHYITYRDTRTRARNVNSAINKTITDLIYVDSKDNDAKRENANIDGDSTMGSMLKIGGTVTKEYNLTNLVKPKYTELHRSGAIHIHDLDFMALCFNCLQIPLGKLLDNGFATGHGYLRTPATISSAATLACIIIQASQNDCFGGQAIPTFDYDLAPYVAKSYIRHIVNYLEAHHFGVKCMTKESLKEGFIKPLDKYIMKNKTITDKQGKYTLFDTLCQYLLDNGCEPKMFMDDSQQQCMLEYADMCTERETFQAMEATVHNLCTLASRAGAQVPFSSLNLGTCTSDEGRRVTRNLLLAVEAGLGYGETAIFPISIFKLKKGVNRDVNDPNYDLYRLALKVTAKRLFPNFLNLDAPFNLKYYKKGRPETEVTAMGALTGKSVLHIDTDDASIDIPFKNLESYLLQNKLTTTTTRKQFDEYTYYYDLVDGVYTRDSLADDNKARIKRFMVFNDPKLKWIIIKFAVKAMSLRHVSLFTYTNYIIVTSDHPLPVINEYGNTVRTRADEIKVGDLLVPARNPYAFTCEVYSIEECKEQYIGYDIETSTDRFDTESIVSHNCRTRTIGNIHDPSKEVVTGRGNLFFTTINLPYIALEALQCTDEHDELVDIFFKKLEQRLKDVVDFSMDRFNLIAKRKAKNYPFLMGQHLYVGSENLLPDDEIREVIKHGSMTAGFIGLAETLVVLTGKHHGESYVAQELGLKIVKFMYDYMNKVAEETKLNFGIMGSPAEGCSGRLLRLTRKKFGTIPGVTDKEYFTNSFHVEVAYEISAYDKIRIEAPYHQYCPAGQISYLELNSDAVSNIDAMETLVNAMCDSGMGYFAINHPVDRDPVCGYVGYFPNGVCPRCGRKEGEGVSVSKLLSLRSYSPDPEYDARREISSANVTLNLVK